MEEAGAVGLFKEEKGVHKCPAVAEYVANGSEKRCDAWHTHARHTRGWATLQSAIALAKASHVLLLFGVPLVVVRAVPEGDVGFALPTHQDMSRFVLLIKETAWRCVPHTPRRHPSNTLHTPHTVRNAATGARADGGTCQVRRIWISARWGGWAGFSAVG